MNATQRLVQIVKGAKGSVIVIVSDNQLIQKSYTVLLFTFLSFSIHYVHPTEFSSSNSNLQTCGS